MKQTRECGGAPPNAIRQPTASHSSALGNHTHHNAKCMRMPTSSRNHPSMKRPRCRAPVGRQPRRHTERR
eukprot:6162245-Alexandrium_andersonii.AAC.1